MNKEQYYKIQEQKDKLSLKGSKLVRTPPENITKRKHQLAGMRGRWNYLQKQSKKYFEE